MTADSNTRLDNIFTQLEVHFLHSAERLPLWRGEFIQLAKALDDFVGLPGKFTVAEDGTRESTEAASDKNAAAFAAREIIIAAEIEVLRASNYKVYEEFKAVHGLIDQMNDIFKDIPSASEKCQRLQAEVQDIFEDVPVKSSAAPVMLPGRKKRERGGVKKSPHVKP